MKALVFLLVLANLLFYAFSAGYFGRPENPDAGRLEQQVEPDKMRLVSHGEAPPASKKPVEPAPVAPVDVAPAPEVAPVPAPAPAPAPVIEKICLRWESLPVADANRLSARIDEKFAGFKQVKRAVAAEGAGWWVYIPPLPGKDEAEKKAGELRQFGVTDYFIIQEAGPSRFAISLGVFSSEKGGQERLAELKAKGVRSAKLNVRPGKESLITLEANGPATDKAALSKAALAIVPKAPAVDCK
ncbi:hypothetical protein AT959_20130 [Dechloromonas denitrificans]|uniref:SPOR domain-containing protein n=1 Tax=Dechloromonas denitrificans TaxID=281362 RepID=A0A133XDW0_9RHOO|nr:SPOR domain-containing protein [Dechloromonas denitrificans]KXB29120.1 hypothetical protein AT959_20130 [Dechloromonas denitrificans]